MGTVVRTRRSAAFYRAVWQADRSLRKDKLPYLTRRARQVGSRDSGAVTMKINLKTAAIMPILSSKEGWVIGLSTVFMGKLEPDST